jgi:site-specific DNA-cytosine methylase
MQVLSLFDGVSCARVALDRAGIPVASYYASEIDKNAICVAQKNYPSTIQLGSVVGLSPPACDLLIGGSPCVDLSIAKKDRKGLEGEHSGLFWEWVRVWKETKPKWWVLENVASMPKKDRDIITKELGVEPVMFDASLVSAQSRKRLFWTNIKFDLPKDRGILLKDILQPDGEVDERMLVKGGKSACIDANYHKGSSVEHAIKKKVRTMVKVGREVIRKLTPIECERLQGLPDNYTDGIAMTQRYRCCGNAFNVDVVAHILRHINPHCPSSSSSCECSA